MRLLLTARELIGAPGAPRGPVDPREQAWLLVEDGVIAALGSRSTHPLPAHDRHLDYPGAALAPTLFDLHVHGSAGHDVMEESPGALGTIGGFMATRGVGAYLPTTVTAPVEPTLRAVEALAAAIERGPEPGIATPLGIHMEGPFLSHAKRGVHPAELLQPPSVALFERFWQASRGTIRLITIAPELPEALPLIQHATTLGVRVSLGHSNATAAEAAAGIRAGARSATHTFNAMRALDHREPGIAGIVLDAEDLYAEIICDGIHVDPAMIRLFFAAKGSTHALLVTDGLSAAGMPDGHYVLGEMDVDVQEGRCTHNGILAGSVLTLDRAVRNFVTYTGASLATAVGLASANPAALAGEAGRRGALATGRRADVLVLSAQGEVLTTLLGGVPVSPSGAERRPTPR